LANPALLGNAVLRQRPVDGVDDRVAMAKLLQGGFCAIGDTYIGAISSVQQLLPPQVSCPLHATSASWINQVER